MSDDPASKDGFRWEMSQHIASRLRQQPECATIAAFMQDEIEAWRQAMQKAERDINELRDALEVEQNALNHLHTDRNNLRLEVERLTRERDAARREVCLYEAEARSWDARKAGMTDWRVWPNEVAAERGWDCFKETP